MESPLRKIIDFEKVDALLEGFNKTTGFVTAILDLEGNVLSKSGWRRICTDFHRINSETSVRCTQSDTILANKLAVQNRYHFYNCLNGLVDVAVPIIINGEHVANLFSGQFFFEEPDIQFFTKQAQQFGFDEESYIKAVKEVPVISEEKVKIAMDFVLNMTHLISDLGFQKKELIEHQDLIREMGKVAKIGGWEFDAKTGKGTWTEETSKIYDLDPQDETNVEIGISFYKPHSREKIEQAIQEAITLQKPYSLELELVTANGKEKWVQTIGEPILENGVVVKVRGSFQDITDRKKIEEKIRKLNLELEDKVLLRTAQLEASNKELEAFTYSVSHDLRAPLRHINGYVDLLNTKFIDQLPAKAQHYLATVSNAAKQMGTLIDDLLQFSRTGRQEVYIEKVDCNKIIKGVIEELEPLVKNRTIHWEIMKLPIVMGDPSLLFQVWINLIDNALKYSRTISTTKISIGLTETADEYCFYIKDNGVGFDMQYVHKLFGVFQRLHSQKEFEGTGIGLANVQRIIHKHKGKVWAEAELDTGAIFYFSLPKIREELL